MKIILAFLIFSAIVLFHELGHFLLAKKNGIVVTEFSLGMGPRLLSKEWKGTRYSLKALPLGGSCAMLGEDTDEEMPGSFHAASVGARFCVVAAGPVFNFILAFALSILIVAMAGYDPAVVSEVTEGSNAAAAGLKAGDVITSYNGYDIDLARDLYAYLYMNQISEDDVISLTVERDGKEIPIVYKPDVTERYLLGFNRTGIDSMEVESLIPGYPLEDAGLKPGDVITKVGGVDIPDGAAYEAYLAEHPLDGSPLTITYVRDGLPYEVTITPLVYRTPSGGFAYNVAYEKVSGLSVLKYAAVEMRYMLRSTLLSLKELVTGGLGVKDLSGPVGIVNVIGETYEESKSEGWKSVLVNLLSIAVLLSTNLGIMNLLPLPALDGGRLVFLILEGVRRKPINRNVEGSIHFTGLILLLVLMVFVMYNDVMKIL